MHKRPYFIAEVKTCSPFGYVSAESWNKQFARAIRYGDMISVHTDPRWGGDVSLIKKAAALTKLPILAKGIHESDADIKAALVAGASAVLVVGRVPDRPLLKHCLLEPTNISQLQDFTCSIPTDQRVVWNSRDLSTGLPRPLSQFEEARKLWPGWLCQASNISAPSDVSSQADAILVGQNLPMFTTLL